MRKALLLIVLVSLVVCAFGVQKTYAEDKPLAMIVKVDGDVKVQRGGKQKAIVTKFALLEGDKVIASGGGSALVLFSTGKKVSVTGELDITPDAAKIEGKEVDVAGGAGGLLMDAVAGGDKNADLKAKGGVAGAVRAAGDAEDVQLLALLNTSTTETRPVFAWKPSAPAEKSTVVLMDEDGEEIWSTETTDQLAKLPEDMDPLEKGMEYTYEVASVIDGEEISAASTFYVLDEDETEEVTESVDTIKDAYATDDDLVIQHMLLASYFKEMELYDAAIDELKKLIALDEYDINSYMMLADIYDTTGNKAAFKETIKKVDEIEREIGSMDEF